MIRHYIIFALVVAAVAWHFYDRHEAYNNGARAVMLEWRKAESASRAKAEAERIAAQAKINQIERDYLTKQRSREAQIADLEASLELERLEDVPQPNCTCGPAISKRLRDNLNGIR